VRHICYERVADFVSSLNSRCFVRMGTNVDTEEENINKSRRSEVDS